MNARHAAVLWTGGKDSCLALHEALDAGLPVRELITFAPPTPGFLAHPVEVMARQAEALGLPHRVLEVTAPFRDSYENHIRRLREQEGLDLLITGDIAEVAGAPNWIRACSRPAGMAVSTPLWGRDRLTLLEQFLTREIVVLFSCVKTKWLPADWVGRELNTQTISDLQALRARNGLDLCGEEGEYHTIVIDSPRFQRRLEFHETSCREMPELAHFQYRRVSLKEKSLTGR